MDSTKILQHVIGELKSVFNWRDLLETWERRQEQRQAILARPQTPVHAADIAPFIDHTLLKADANATDIQKLCSEAMLYNFKSVCVNSSWVTTCHDLLKTSATFPISVVGFPLGAMDSVSKAFEARQAILNGAKEIDTVIPIGPLKSGDLESVLADLITVNLACGTTPVKVIIECALLSSSEKIKACELALTAGCDFVKTSTGFNGAGATIEDIQLMTTATQNRMYVKASGGIKNFEQAKALIAAGAHRLGTSSGVSIIKGQNTTESY